MPASSLSPDIIVNEQDFTLTVPAVSSTVIATAGVFSWGPVLSPYLLASEQELVDTFGYPSDWNYKHWFTAADSLAYAKALYVNRLGLATARNAVSVTPAAVTGTAAFTAGSPNVTGTGTTFTNLAVGDQLIYTVSGTQYTSFIKTITSATAIILETNATVTSPTTTVTSVSKAVINNASDYSTKTVTSLSNMGKFVAKYPGVLGNSIKVSIADSASYGAWTYKSLFQSAPSTSDYCSKFTAAALDEMHIVVVDSLGAWTGVPGTVLETFGYVSKASDATGFGGSSIYYKNVVNTSKYIWWTGHQTTGLSGTGLDIGTAAQATMVYKTITAATDYQLSYGYNGDAYTDGELELAYDQYRNEDIYDISLIAIGSEKAAVAAYVTSNVAEPRMDIIVFCSPNVIADGTPIIGDTSTEATATVAYRSAMALSSSYYFMDSGWYYRYDKYNDVYRWVPLSGSTAGIKARSDLISDVWKSPAGLNRGQYKNVVRLAMNPSKAMRDLLFSSNINPVVAFPGQGVVLWGDKTGLSKPSSFDMISVRSLFIMLEKAIKRAARFQLFENNTPFTRAQFRAYIEPYLRDIKGRDGVNDFKVVCDETNNTPAVISRNEFIGTILIKPQYSIRTMYLNFSAVRQDVSFSEVQGNV